MDKMCYFCRSNGECGALIDTYCVGINTECSFYKTEKQYIEDRNRAIEINRAKGNCVGCKYCNKKCEVITGYDISGI